MNTPKSFKPYQNEIILWLTCLLWNQPQEMQWNQEPIQSKLLLGADMNNISSHYQSYKILIWTTSPNSNESKTLGYLHMQSEILDSILKDLTASNPNHVNPPSIAWHRPSA
jgi:hypothetical protein